MQTSNAFYQFERSNHVHCQITMAMSELGPWFMLQWEWFKSWHLISNGVFSSPFWTYNSPRLNIYMNGSLWCVCFFAQPNMYFMSKVPDKFNVGTMKPRCLSIVDCVVHYLRWLCLWCTVCPHCHFM